MGFKEKSWGPLSSAAALALSVTLIWTGFMQFVPETGIRIGLNPPARRCLQMGLMNQTEMANLIRK